MPSAAAPAIIAALDRLDRERGLPPLRDHRLKERRERLKKTRKEIAELAGFEASWAGERRVEAVEAGVQAEDEPAVRWALVYLESEPRRRREHLRREERRIAALERAFVAVLESPGGRALGAVMLKQALDLMFNGNGEGCDAIAEFLPKNDVTRMLDLWEASQETGTSPDDACVCCVPPITLDLSPDSTAQPVDLLETSL